MHFQLVNTPEERSVMLFVQGRDPLQATSATHRDYDEIIRLILADDESVVERFDRAAAAAKRFERLTERVTIRGSKVYLDGDEVDNALVTKVKDFLAEGLNDWKPLLAFFEKVVSNPEKHSREQLYTFVANNEITLFPDGDFVGYKGMRRDLDEAGTFYKPVHNGHIIVDGEDFPKSNEAKQRVGSIVEMPRAEVAHNPNQHCAVGLHIATHDYAKSWGTVLEVRVNPRDVVSVPHDTNQKVRACRYVIVGEIAAPYKGSVRKSRDDPPAQAEPRSFETPTEAEFQTMVDRAKRRRRNLADYARKHGPWSYVGLDAPSPDSIKVRTNWRKTPKSA